MLAYSTISQIGYMFLALGVGAWSAAIFHFMTHAFFKALLFLPPALVIKACDEEHDIFKMGACAGACRSVFWTFLIGARLAVGRAAGHRRLLQQGPDPRARALAPGGRPWLWAVGVVGAFLTSLYTFRLVFLVFFGDVRQLAPASGRARPMLIPRGRLAVSRHCRRVDPASARTGGVSAVHRFPAPVLADAAGSGPDGFAGSAAPQVLVAVAVALGIYLAYCALRPPPGWLRRVVAGRPVRVANGLALAGWGFDRLYDLAIRRGPSYGSPGRARTTVDRPGFSTAWRWTARQLNALLSRTQTGRLRCYSAVAAGGRAGLRRCGGVAMILAAAHDHPVVWGRPLLDPRPLERRVARWTALRRPVGGFGLAIGIWAGTSRGVDRGSAGSVASSRST